MSAHDATVFGRSSPYSSRRGRGYVPPVLSRSCPAKTPMPFSSDAYSPAQKTLHWLIAALVVVLVPVGLSMANLMEDGPIKNGAYELHKSFGLTVFGLALLRVAVRLVRAPLVPGILAWQRAAARGSHYALYLLIILVPLSGWTATSTCCAPVNLFWTVPLTLPLPWEGGMDQSKPIFLVHYALAFALTAIVLVHVSAALHHHFVRRDRTLLRMLPGRSAASQPGKASRSVCPTTQAAAERRASSHDATSSFPTWPVSRRAGRAFREFPDEFGIPGRAARDCRRCARDTRRRERPRPGVPTRRGRPPDRNPCRHPDGHGTRPGSRHPTDGRATSFRCRYRSGPCRTPLPAPRRRRRGAGSIRPRRDRRAPPP